MKSKLLIGLLFILSMVFLFSCSEKKEPLDFSTHPDGWAQESSEQFHGKALLDSNLTLMSCQSCHGEDFKGGSSKVSCFECHDKYPHPKGWLNQNSLYFHGKILLDSTLTSDYCQDCHGQDYEGGSSNVACSDCHDQFPHPAGWISEDNSNFHGKLLLFNILSLADCQSCHGDDLSGGTSGVACADCHENYPHPAGFSDENSESFHAKYISQTLNWDILSCRSCHGTDYSGETGFQQTNCLNCHRSTNGPEACNTCHGSQNNAAPPEDLAGNTNTTSQSVGAHQAHLVGTTWSTYKPGDCAKCHIKPASYEDSGHIDDTPHAEIPFGALATMNGELNTTYDFLNASCDNVYCHGGFEFKKSDSNYPWAYTDSLISGNNPTLHWKYVGAGQALCGSCHGLPPEGHIQANACGGCHADVVDNNLNITNKYLHINGKKDVF